MRDLSAIKKIVILVCIGFVMFGCKKEKEIIQFPDNEIKLIGYAHQALFSSTPGFHCYLNISNISTNYINCFLLFKDITGNSLVIYETESSKYILTDRNRVEKKEVALNSVQDLGVLPYQAHQENFSLTVVDKMITLENVECVVFRWHSGGIKIYGFKKLHDGLEGVFSYKKLSESDPQNTAFVHFTTWNKTLDDWPVVESIVWGKQ